MIGVNEFHCHRYGVYVRRCVMLLLLSCGSPGVSFGTDFREADTDSVTRSVRHLDKVTKRHDVRKVRSIRSGYFNELSGSDMQRMGLTEIRDAMNHFAGVTLRDYGGAGGIKTVSVRGLGASHTAVAYDGFIMSDVQTGQIDLSRFSLRDVRSITLTVGDGFSLFEPSRAAAAAATVNIQTEWNDATDKGGTLRLEHGSFGRVGAMAKWKGVTRRGNVLSATADWISAQNDYPYILKNGLFSTREYRVNNRINTLRTEINAALNLGKRSVLDGKLYFFNNCHHLPGAVVLYNPISNERQHDVNLFGQVRWRKMFNDKWTLQMLGKWGWTESEYTDRNGIYTGGLLKEIYWQREWYASALLRYLADEHWGMSYAVDYVFNNLNGNVNSGIQASRHTVFQSFTLNYTLDRLCLSGRMLCSSYFNKAAGQKAADDVCRFSPSLSASYGLCDLVRLRAFYKDIFRVPTFTESYYYHLGNADLVPERTHQLGGGVVFERRMAYWWPTFSLTVDVYDNHVVDKIVSVPVNLHLWRTINLGRVEARGLDVTLHSGLQWRQKHILTLFGNMTYQNVKDKTRENELTFGKQLAYMPDWSGAASVSYENPWVNVSVNGNAVAARYATHDHATGTYLPGYAEFGVSAWRVFPLFGTKCEARANVQNIFDKQYDVVVCYPMPGRSYTVALKFHL